ncbi:MAG: hypothetical protein R3C11_11075 [Planctomycetaceae bacterium]
MVNPGGLISGFGQKGQNQQADHENRTHGESRIPHWLRVVLEDLAGQHTEGEKPGCGDKATCTL